MAGQREMGWSPFQPIGRADLTFAGGPAACMWRDAAGNTGLTVCARGAGDDHYYLISWQPDGRFFDWQDQWSGAVIFQSKPAVVTSTSIRGDLVTNYFGNGYD